MELQAALAAAETRERQEGSVPFVWNLSACEGLVGLLSVITDFQVLTFDHPDKLTQFIKIMIYGCCYS